MAGETEDCISFQADHLPTGSISFGRFEVETLSWERKSSFCRNRYLEEVEKYSTPGSVTQKRAILEAHFKKKPLFPQDSSDCKSVSECQQAGRKGSKSWSNEYEDNEIKPELCWYDDSPSCSDDHEGLAIEQVIVDSVPPCNNDETVLDTKDKMADHDRNPEDQLLNKDVISEHEPENKAVIMEELLENKEAIAMEEVKSCVESKCSEENSEKMNTSKKKTQTSSHKVKEANEHKSANSIRKSANDSPNARKSTIERNHAPSVKMISRSVENQEQKRVAKSKSVEQAPIRPRPKSSVSRNPKSEIFSSMEAKERKENMSSEANGKKNVKATKSSPRPHSTSGRNEVNQHKSPNRPKHGSIHKEESRQIGTVFSLKTDERAEQRKEYFMKLEKKLQAKEAEMSEIQTKTKEQTEAAIKLFRKSLNYKAKPLPSFYGEAVSKSSERKKKAAVLATESQALLKEKPKTPSRASNRATPSNASSKVQTKSPVVKNSSSKKGDTVNMMKKSTKTEVIGSGSVAVHGA